MNVTVKPQKVSVSVNSETLRFSTGAAIARDYVEREPYTGDYTVTPSSEAQTIRTNGLRMTDNITIEPIPSNYGLITWNGITLTVS